MDLLFYLIMGSVSFRSVRTLSRDVLLFTAMVFIFICVYHHLLWKQRNCFYSFIPVSFFFIVPIHHSKFSGCNVSSLTTNTSPQLHYHTLLSTQLFIFVSLYPQCWTAISSGACGCSNFNSYIVA